MTTLLQNVFLVRELGLKNLMLSNSFFFYCYELNFKKCPIMTKSITKLPRPTRESKEFKNILLP